MDGVAAAVAQRYKLMVTSGKKLVTFGRETRGVSKRGREMLQEIKATEG